MGGLSIERLAKRIDTVFVEVTDLNRSIPWYTEILDYHCGGGMGDMPRSRWEKRR